MANTLEYMRRWREANKDRMRQYQREYLVRERARVHSWYEGYREWLKTGNLTQFQMVKRYVEDGGRCYLCGTDMDLRKIRFNPHEPRGFDHVKPRFNEGQNIYENIRVCCRKCNVQKRTRSLEEFEKMKGVDK